MPDPFQPHRPGDPFGSRDRSGRLVLDADAAAELNALVAELRRLGRVAVAPPLEFSDGPSGRRWGVSRPEPVYVRLSGSASPYGWAEAVRVSGGTSAVVPGGRTGTAYEANAAAGLGGKYATIDWTAAGDWRFQAIGTGAAPDDKIHYPAVCCYRDGIPRTLHLTTDAVDPFLIFGTSGLGLYVNQNYYVNADLTYSTTGPPDDPAATVGASYVGGFGGPGAIGGYAGIGYWWSPLIQPGRRFGNSACNRPGGATYPATDSLGYHYVFKCEAEFSGPNPYGFSLGLVYACPGASGGYLYSRFEWDWYDPSVSPTTVNSCSPFLMVQGNRGTTNQLRWPTSFTPGVGISGGTYTYPTITISG